MKILPYIEEITEDADIKHIFRVENHSEYKPTLYETTITLIPIDINEWKFLEATCSCKGFTCKKTKECKHIRFCRERLKEFKSF